MTAAAGGLAAASACAAVLAYLILGLPRMRPAVAAGVTAALALVGVAAGIAVGGWVVAAPLAALLVGHLAWQAGCSAAASAAAPAAPVAVAAATPRLPESDPRPVAGGPPSRPGPATLGRYRIDGVLGRGAMGAVYLGHDPKISRQVAIKTMALGAEFEGAALEEARARFFREAETAGRLQHPDIVTIYDAGEDQGLAYIAMEVLRGRDLSGFTQPGKLLPAPVAVAIVARVADALAYAHSQGVVHRDIKPANVMVDLDSDQVKVTDFGIARITDSSRTRTGMVLGTPAYMSPEQMAGRRVDGRSDLYSLGVMLFQLLTGTLPHRADSMAKLMYAIANEPAPDVRSLRADLPEALADAVALALQKRPEMRCADGRQWAADLRTIAGVPASAAVPAPSVFAPGGDAFAATVKFDRTDPRQNPGP
jgi:serine/threonine-protein kinase